MTARKPRKGIEIEPEWVVLANSCKELKITKVKLESFVGSSQCVEKAYSLSACGDIFQLSVQTLEGRISVAGFCHAEMKGSDVYACECLLDLNYDYAGHVCPCKGTLSHDLFVLTA